MEYTKAQILKIKEEKKPIVFKALDTIDDNVAYISTEEGYNFKCQMYVDGALEKLSDSLEVLADVIIESNDYELGVEIFERLMPVWRKFCTGANRGEFRIHEAAHQVQSIINYFQKWVKKNEPKSSVMDSLVAFEELAHECIAFIGLKYGTRKGRPKSQALILKQKDSYQEMVQVSDLTYEIRRHIENSNSPSETDRYICSLLTPFKEFCSVLRPQTPTEESQRFIRLLCTGTNYHGANESDSIERILRNLLYEMNKFAKGLYDVLIQNGLDLNEYQQKTGVYLRRKWNPAEGVFFEVDNWDLLEHLPILETPLNTISETPPNTTSDNSYILNDKILKALPDLYDYLVEDGVIYKSLIGKQDFTNKVTSGSVPVLKTGESLWVNKVVKFKCFIKCIKKCFNDAWYEVVCLSAGTTTDKKLSYNTDSTKSFKKKIEEKLKQNGIE